MNGICIDCEVRTRQRCFNGYVERHRLRCPAAVSGSLDPDAVRSESCATIRFCHDTSDIGSSRVEKRVSWIDRDIRVGRVDRNCPGVHVYTAHESVKTGKCQSGDGPCTLVNDQILYGGSHVVVGTNDEVESSTAGDPGGRVGCSGDLCLVRCGDHR